MLRGSWRNISRRAHKQRETRLNSHNFNVEIYRKSGRYDCACAGCKAMPQKLPFRVTHASGQDGTFKASELNNHSPLTKGWQSSRFCLYPQDIVVQLDERARIRKLQILSHQYLIATKIEFFVGDVPEDTAPNLQNARYTRLGYVAIANNEKTGYKARELKSVHVDAVGSFVKFVIHKNHVNRHNLYNQVGIVALNVIGDPLSEVDLPEVQDNRVTEDPSLANIYNRPDYISPLDDLAFDMYQDPEVAQIIRKLERKKQEAVLQERYDYAKKLKQAISELQKVGEKLGKYEVEKRQAVESEDFDKAKLKKVQMDEYRLQVYKQLEIHDLLELSGPRHPIPVDLGDAAQKPPTRLSELPQSPVFPSQNSPPHTPYDDRPLPAIKNRDPVQEQPKPEVSPRTPHDERQLPALKGNQALEEDELPTEDPSGGVTGEPEPMTEKDQREAAHVIDVFGQPVVSKAYSKTFSFREDALLEVYRLMNELEPSASKEEAKSMMRAAVFLINRAIKDKVFAVFKAGLNLLSMILTSFVPKHKIPKTDTVYAVEKTLPALLQKSGDTAARNRDAAKQYIVEESSFAEVKPLQVIPHGCVKPFKLNTAPRLALSRTEVLDMLYRQHGLGNSGLSVDNMMPFCTNALQHTSGDVREKAEKLIIALYKEVGAPVKDFLPPDDEKTRKNVMYKMLFEAFDRIDGKPSKEEQKKQQLEQEAVKQKEIDALQSQLAALRAAANKAEESARGNDGSKPKQEKKDKDKKNKAQSKPKGDDSKLQDDASMYNIDNTCIFCGEKNQAFTEEGLDLHYWKSCPMLKRCANCKQVVEISGLTDHLLTECDNKANFTKCSRCTEAIPKAEFEQHDKAKSCNPAQASKNHCPLCHQNLPSGEESWKQHLMGRDGCKQNPRRMQALNRGKGGAKAGTSKGKAPNRATRA